MNNYKTKTEYEHTLESAIAAVGAAIADISRVKILCALMDGRAWTATELSIVADISAHLPQAAIYQNYSVATLFL